MIAGTLSPQVRQDDLRRLVDTRLDLLVVGGGVVGAGIALDAATRGLSVALVEAQDWASGTSSRSSKLVHGGLRYLERLELRLVREALHERGLMLDRLAPHLVTPVPFLYPLRRRGWERAYVGAGVLLYDALARVPGGRGRLPRHRHLGRRAALAVAPGLRADSLVGAVQYHDAQVDDARHTLTVVRTAAAHGAVTVNRMRMTELVSDGDRVTGARLVDAESGARLTARARVVVSATGVWTNQTHRAADVASPYSVRASKGVHLLLPRELIDLHTGVILRTEMSVLFVIPWDRHWLVGTTDTEWRLDAEEPTATAADLDYLLGQLNTVLRSPVGPDDVVGVYAGLRPLVARGRSDTVDLSREHVVAGPRPGLVTVAGGKYTTYRVMAEDAVDHAVLGWPHPVPASCTDRIPLLGAEGWAAVWNGRSALARRTGLDIARVERLLRRYGSMVDDVLELGTGDPELLRPIPGAEHHLGVEIVYAATHEGARRLDDVLRRRTRASLDTGDRGVSAAPHVARLLAPLLGWDEERVHGEVAQYVARDAAERAAQRCADDATADAVMRGRVPIT